MAEWNFPTNGGGVIRGLADSGIETFNGKKDSSLAREICQNSLDAAADTSKPVIVRFQTKEITPENIPGYTEYKKILDACRDYWKENSNAKNFFNQALNKIKIPSTVLIVSDENTTGLANPFNPNSFEGWNTLTKIDGGANKSGSTGGSFGIGKNAPFAISDFRLVFYRTLNQRGESAAQGVSRLVSFNQKNDTKAGIGYYGNPNKNLPVEKISALEKILTRTKIGTDIFIYGFNAAEKWRGNILFELVENFLVTIYRGKLIVEMPNYTVDKNYLQKIIPKQDKYLKEHKSQARSYYKVLTAADSDLKIFEEDFHGLGKLKLKILIDPRADLNRKILVVRQMGMKIFDLKRFPKHLNFTGIVEIEGAALNNFFRQMENPEHNHWEPSRHPNAKLAKQYFTDFKDWVRSKVKSLGENFISDEKNVEGLSANLQRNKILPVIQTAAKKVEKLNPVANSPILKIETATAPENKTLSTGGGSDTSKYKTARGTVTDQKDDKPAVRTLKGKRPRKNKKNHTGVEDPEGADIVLTPAGNFLECKNRVIKIGKNNYRLILQVPKNIFSGNIKIFAVGEDDAQEQLKISSVKANCNAQVSEQKIQLFNIPANKNLHINFSLAEDNGYSLRTYVYEDE
ncbi:MAG: hypothetical protein IJT73_05150 [Selenomonadaceae bacterium]|nr:hypothetical protein [Selenomonadaceae bacterium]